MTRVDEIIERAKDGLPESEVAILAREVLKTREQLALALRAKGDAEGLAALADRCAALRNKKLVVVSTPPTEHPYEELIRKYEGVTIFPRFPRSLRGAPQLRPIAQDLADLQEFDGANSRRIDSQEAMQASASDWIADSCALLASNFRSIHGVDYASCWRPDAPAESDDHVARFHDCPRNEVCTPDGCKAGAGNWPRCPKTSTEPTL